MGWSGLASSLLSFFAQIWKSDVDRVETEQKMRGLPYCRMAIKWRGEPIQVYPDMSRRVELEVS